MKTCEKCGASFEEEVKVCPNCGISEEKEGEIKKQ